MKVTVIILTIIIKMNKKKKKKSTKTPSFNIFKPNTGHNNDNSLDMLFNDDNNQNNNISGMDIPDFQGVYQIHSSSNLM